MIYSLRGEITHAEPGFVVVECGGVGYKCMVSGSTLSALQQKSGEVTVLTHMTFSQDAVTLFGFASPSELSCFKMLTGVSGIGPRTALSVLTAMSPEQLAVSVASGDYKSITRAQGVGPKQAQRIVLELKDKISALGAPTAEIPAAGGLAPAAVSTAKNAAEAISALMVLGCSSGEASALVAKLDPSLKVEELIRQALRLMNG